MTRSSLHTFKLATLAAAIAMTAVPAVAQQYTLILPSPGVAADPLRNLGVSLADVSLPSGLPGQPYSADLRGALQISDDLPGEPAVAQWNIVSGALPEGLTFVDGVIAGTPTRVEDAHFMVQVTYRGKGAERTYNIPVDRRIGLAAATLPKGQAGAAYPAFDLKTLLSAPGLVGFDPSGATWALGSGSSLPEGLTLDPNTGVISGTPTNEGESQFEVIATSQGASASQTYEVSIGELIGWMHPNGVTVMCPGAPAGATFIIDEKEYIVIGDGDKTGAANNAVKACTSNMTDMSDMSFGSEFNEDISHWDTSNVTTMYRMFRNAVTFNQDVGAWNTSSVTDMDFMFRNASAFNNGCAEEECNNPLEWDTSSVTKMYGMFYDASAFNQYIGGWNTASVTNMVYMFYGASAFNQDIGAWSTANVTGMNGMFYEASAFNQDIGGWNTASITGMTSMFHGAGTFNNGCIEEDCNNPLKWDTSNVISMRGMFQNASDFNQDIGGWNTASVTAMGQMFYGASAFNQDIGGWNTSNVTNMSDMFRDASAFDRDIGDWNTANVKRMHGMFWSSSAFDQDLSGWCVSGISSKPGGFDSSTTAWDKENRQPIWGTCPNG